MTRNLQNVNWNLPNKAETWDQVQVALLMDLRDELKAIRSLLNCHRIPRAFDAISRIDRRLQNAGVLVKPKRAK